jgi:glycosyltransferase involved in cell wall biosynthesis
MPHVIVHSEFVREIVERYGSRAEHTSLIPLAYQAHDQSSTREPQAIGSAPQIVTVGGIAHTKGQHDMLAALPVIVRDYPALQYKMIGEVRDPSYAAFLHRTIARLGLQSNVQLLEGLSDARKNEALARADLYLQPSHEEGFCLAFIEAAGVVARLVGTDTGAIRAICEGDEAARVVPVRSPERIGAAVLTLFKTAPDPQALRRLTSRLAERFGWPQYLSRHEELYARMTDRAQLAQ